MIFFYAPSFNTLFYFFRIIKYNNSILYLCKKIKNDVHSSSYKNIFKGGIAMLKTKSFSKLFSIWFGTPMYWFPDNSDVEYKNLNTDFYHNS